MSYAYLYKDAIDARVEELVEVRATRLKAQFSEMRRKFAVEG
jgi:hypothetical protein